MNYHILYTCTVPIFNSCTKCFGSPATIHNRTPHNATQFTGHRCMHDLTTKVALIHKATWVIDVLGLICFDMLPLVVCTTRYWQTLGRLVQELNVCTVYGSCAKFVCDSFQFSRQHIHTGIPIHKHIILQNVILPTRHNGVK